MDGTRLQAVARSRAEALADVTNGRPFTPHLLVFKVAGRVFLIVTEDPDEQIVTVKADPDRLDALIRDHPTIERGRYLDKRHWLSVASGPGITETLVTELVEDSYDLAVEQLPAKRRPRRTA